MMKMDKQFPLYGFAAHKGRTGNHASLFMVTGKAIGIQLRGRLLSKPSKKTSGCSCEAHPSQKPSGRGVALPQVTALQLTRLVLLELGKGQNEHRIKSNNTNGDIRLNHCRSTRCSACFSALPGDFFFFYQKTHPEMVGSYPRLAGGLGEAWALRGASEQFWTHQGAPVLDIIWAAHIIFISGLVSKLNMKPGTSLLRTNFVLLRKMLSKCQR